MRLLRTQLLAFRLKSDMIERRARALGASSLAIGVAAGLTPLAHTQTHTHTWTYTHIDQVDKTWPPCHNTSEQSSQLFPLHSILLIRTRKWSSSTFVSPVFWLLQRRRSLAANPLQVMRQMVTRAPREATETYALSGVRAAPLLPPADARDASPQPAPLPPLR